MRHTNKGKSLKIPIGILIVCRKVRPPNKTDMLSWGQEQTPVIHMKKKAVKLNCFLQIVFNIELEHYYSLSCFKEL
jgi:hypothetical protein